MTEDIPTPSQQPTAEDSPPGTPGQQSPVGGEGASVQDRATALADERPEVAVGAAFAGGLLLALILKRLAR